MTPLSLSRLRYQNTFLPFFLVTIPINYYSHTSTIIFRLTFDHLLLLLEDLPRDQFCRTDKW